MLVDVNVTDAVGSANKILVIDDLELGGFREIWWFVVFFECRPGIQIAFNETFEVELG